MNQLLEYKSGIISLVKGAPEKPSKPGPMSHQEFFTEYYEDDLPKYNKALAACERIPFEDQEKAFDICWRSDVRINNPISLYNWKQVILKDGDLFSLDVEVEMVTEVKNPVFDHGDLWEEVQPGFENIKGLQYRTVIRIVEPEKKPTYAERIALGECVSERSNSVEHCHFCSDRCEATHFKMAVNEVSKPDPVVNAGQEKSEAWQVWEEDQKTNRTAVNPHAFAYGYNIAKKRYAASTGSQEEHAIEFANFIWKKEWSRLWTSENTWHNSYHHIKSTKQLYEEFKEARKPKEP